jgi:hypothetical protein
LEEAAHNVDVRGVQPEDAVPWGFNTLLDLGLD